MTFLQYFFRDLARIFPDAKVILTVRDPEKWYESVKDSIGTIRSRLSDNTCRKWFSKLIGLYSIGKVIEKIQNHKKDPITQLGR